MTLEYCTPDDVKNFSGIQGTNLFKDDKDGSKTADNKLDELLIDWIDQSCDLINKYTNNTWENKEVPSMIKNVAIRVTGNMVALAQARKDTPVIKVNDWRTEIVNMDLLTDGIKEDLETFVIDESKTSGTVGFYTVTGGR